MEVLRVLIVDDEADFVSVLAERLEARNLKVDTAEDGEIALVKAMKLGALDLLEKPVEIATLVAKIEDAALRRSKLDDKRIEQKMAHILLEKGW